MSKMDKLLYGGFAAVALAGIVAMLVSVFSPPKQIAEEETVETPTIPTRRARQMKRTMPTGKCWN